jgi:hypothetical protein
MISFAVWSDIKSVEILYLFSFSLSSPSLFSIEFSQREIRLLIIIYYNIKRIIKRMMKKTNITTTFSSSSISLRRCKSRYSFRRLLLHRKILLALVSYCYYYYYYYFVLSWLVGNNNTISNDPFGGIIIVVSALDNGVGVLPPMGWISWLRYGWYVSYMMLVLSITRGFTNRNPSIKRIFSIIIFHNILKVKNLYYSSQLFLLGINYSFLYISFLCHMFSV